jgi:hypothetical protein
MAFMVVRCGHRRNALDGSSVMVAPSFIHDAMRAAHPRVGGAEQACGRHAAHGYQHGQQNQEPDTESLHEGCPVEA